MKYANQLPTEEFSIRVKERPHPLLKVPGTRNAKWDAYIGRWVVGKVTYDRTYV